MGRMARHVQKTKHVTRKIIFVFLRRTQEKGESEGILIN